MGFDRKHLFQTLSSPCHVSLVRSSIVLIWTVDQCWMSSLKIYQPQKETAPLHFRSCLVLFLWDIYTWKDSIPASFGSWDQVWYNTRKFFRPFPLSTFAYDFIFHIWNLSWFMVQYSWKFEMFSFIGTKIVLFKTVYNKPYILTGLAEIINKAIKGLNFLHLWGEGRALRLRSVPLADNSILMLIEWNLSRNP